MFCIITSFNIISFDTKKRILLLRIFKGFLINEDIINIDNIEIEHIQIGGAE